MFLGVHVLMRKRNKKVKGKVLAKMARQWSESVANAATKESLLVSAENSPDYRPIPIQSMKLSSLQLCS